MAAFKINGKNFATQTGTGEPNLMSNVVFPAGHIIQTKFVYFDGEQTIGNGSNGLTFVNIGLGVSVQEFAINMSVSSGNKILGFGVIQHSASNR